MAQITDTLIIVAAQIVLLLSFVLLTKFWLNRKNNIYPVIFYWVFGLLFVFLMTSNAVNRILLLTVYDQNSLMRDQDSISTWGSLAGLGVYLALGVFYFKRKVSAKRKLSKDIF